MKIDVQLPPTFTDCNTCTLEAFIFRTVRTPPRHHGWPLKLSGMEARVLSLRLDSSLRRLRGSTRRCEVPRRRSAASDRHQVLCGTNARRSQDRHDGGDHLAADRRSIGKALGVIGESIAWDSEGLAVGLVIGRDEIVV